MSFRSRFICQVESKTACACIQLRVQENSFRLQIVSLHDFLSDVTVVSSVQPLSEARGRNDLVGLLARRHHALPTCGYYRSLGGLLSAPMVLGFGQYS